MNYWVLKGQPSNNFESELRPGRLSRWHTKKPPAKWEVSDRLICWEGAPKLWVVGLAELVNPLVRKEEGETLFQVKYLTRVLASRPTITELRLVPIVQEAAFLKAGPAGTVHRISDDQAKLLVRLIYARNPGLPIVWADIETSVFGALLPDVDLDLSGREGALKLVRHFIRERNRGLIEAKRRTILEEHGRLACEVCAFDFREVYGSRGSDFCEVHHVVPLSNVAAEIETRLEDLAILCSNCHRMIHRQPELGVEQLRRSLRKGLRGAAAVGG
jgi:hypothetical protein